LNNLLGLEVFLLYWSNME